MSNPYAATFAPANSDQEATTTVPRLGISHLFLWLTLTAILLAVSSNFTAPDLGSLYTLISATSAVMSATSITGLWVLFRARPSLATMMCLPGHWIVFCQAIVGIAVAIMMCVNGQGWSTPPDWATSYYWTYRLWEMTLPMLVGGLAVATYAYAAYRNDGAWRLLFGIGALLAFSEFIIPIGVSFFPTANPTVSFSLASYGNFLLCLAMIVVACFAEHRGPRRDWVHWLGIVCLMMGIAFNILWSTVAYFGWLTIN